MSLLILFTSPLCLALSLCLGSFFLHSDHVFLSITHFYIPSVRISLCLSLSRSPLTFSTISISALSFFPPTVSFSLSVQYVFFSLSLNPCSTRFTVSFSFVPVSLSLSLLDYSRAPPPPPSPPFPPFQPLLYLCWYK